MGMFVGSGTTVTFPGGWTPELLDVSGPNTTREGIDFSHLGTTGAKPKRPGDMYDAGELTLELAFDPDDKPDMTGVAGTITITWADSTPTAEVLTGFVTEFTPTAPIEGRATASCKWMISG